MSIKVNFNSELLNNFFAKTKASAADVTEAARTGVAAVGLKANDTLACAKLHRAINELEEEIDLQLCDIGRLVYATHIGNPSDSEEIQKILTYVDGLYEEIAAHEEELDRLQGSRICSICGAENAPDNVYCQDCGNPFPADGATSLRKLSEVSQKEKHQYSILTHIYGI